MVFLSARNNYITNFSYNFGLHTLYLPPPITITFVTFIFCGKNTKIIQSFLLYDGLKPVYYHY